MSASSKFLGSVAAGFIAAGAFAPSLSLAQTTTADPNFDPAICSTDFTNNVAACCANEEVRAGLTTEQMAACEALPDAATTTDPTTSPSAGAASGNVGGAPGTNPIVDTPAEQSGTAPSQGAVPRSGPSTGTGESTSGSSN